MQGMILIQRRFLVMLVMCGTLRVEAAVSRDQLRTWFAEALDAAREVPAEKRYDATNALSFEGSTEEVVKTGLLKMALRPNSEVPAINCGVHNLSRDHRQDRASVEHSETASMSREEMVA